MPSAWLAWMPRFEDAAQWSNCPPSENHLGIWSPVWYSCWQSRHRHWLAHHFRIIVNKIKSWHQSMTIELMDWSVSQWKLCLLLNSNIMRSMSMTSSLSWNIDNSVCHESWAIWTSWIENTSSRGFQRTCRANRAVIVVSRSTFSLSFEILTLYCIVCINAAIHSN